MMIKLPSFQLSVASECVVDLILVRSHEHLERSERRAPRRYGKQTIEVAPYLLAS